MGILRKIEKPSFPPPPKPELKIDEKTAAYIEKLKGDPAFDGPLDIKVGDFDGPLDLLLELVRRARINIEDIFVSPIVDQYLQLTMQQVGDIDFEKATEFIKIASILLEIKAKSLLHKPEENDETSIKRERSHHEEEYALFTELFELMKEKEAVGFFHRLPDPITEVPHVVMADLTTDGLVKAFQKLFLRFDKKHATILQRKIVKDRFTVAEKITNILMVMKHRKQVNFSELFEGDATKNELITTFQALLELLKSQEITVEQPDIFADIIKNRKEIVS